ncbi:MAG: hypothetical protein WBN19_14825 [Lutimonas sp.]
MKRIVSVLIFFLVTLPIFAQVYTNIEVGRNREMQDSTETSVYPYHLPIWGEKVTKLGYDIPYSAGMSINYFTQESDLIIENLSVGFNNGPMYDLEEIIRFENAVAGANSVTLRPDIWLFPFLNIYGIFGTAKTSTNIDAGLWLPNPIDNTWSEIASFSTKANFDATTFGLGITPTIGIGGGWLALDMNMTWTDVSALNEPVFTFVFGPRLGKTFKFKKEDMNIAAWVGAFRVKLSSTTEGSLNLSDVIPIDELEAKVDQGLVRADEAQQNLNSWWDGLTPVEQIKPSNIAKYELGNRTITKATDVLTSVDGALSNGETATVQYTLEKRPKDMWNFIVGSQLQINKHWMLRAEYGFLGSRQQFMTGLQYRFRL